MWALFLYTLNNFAENNDMKEAVNRALKTFRYYTDKRFSTIAGTLAYFFLMSIAPFLLWLTLLLGSIDVEQLLPDKLFESISPFINYLEESAQSAVSGSGIILILTSLYSSTNFFYHLRRSGEIVYGSIKAKGGVKLRIISAVLIILTIFLIAFIASLSFTLKWILQSFMPEVLIDAILLVFFAVYAFFAAILLNLFACPYKLKISEALTGSLLTTVLWIIFILGFALYLQFASPGKLYGAIASIIVFLLWSYFMMCCFVIGMIKNGADITVKRYKKLL